MNVDEVKTSIRTGMHTCDRVAETVADVADQIRTATAMAAATTDGTAHPAALRGLARLKQAEHETELLRRRLQAATAAAGAYLELLG